MSEPRDVPPEDVEVFPPGTTDEEFRRRYYHERREEPEWLAWKWASRGRGFPWLGVLLVLIGAALLVQYLVPTVAAGTLVLLAIGLAFLVGWLVGGSWFSMVPGVLLVSLAGARLIENLNIYDGPGLTSVALAIGFLVIWLLAYSTNRRWTWSLWAAAIFGLIGLVQLSGELTGLPELRGLWPVLIIGAGILLLLNARRR
jgi:hypothetical protein